MAKSGFHQGGRFGLWLTKLTFATGVGVCGARRLIPAIFRAHLPTEAANSVGFSRPGTCRPKALVSDMAQDDPTAAATARPVPTNGGGMAA